MSGFSNASGETTSLLRRFVEDLGAPSSYRDRSYQGSQDDLERDLSVSSTVYVGNLSFYTTEEQIYALFSKSGPVKRVIMGLDRNQKTPCGFCFVEYFTREDALLCKKFQDGSKLDDRFVRVDLDPGFVEGRQFGRGRRGGQVRDEMRHDYDAGRGGWGGAALNYDYESKDEIMTLLGGLAVHLTTMFLSALTCAGLPLSRKLPLSILYRAQCRLFSSAAPSRPEIEERILKTLRASDKLDSTKLHLETPFTQLGLDSLDVVEVIVNLEEEFHLQIPDAVADKAQNPKDVAEYIYNFLHPASKDNHKDNISEESH